MAEKNDDEPFSFNGYVFPFSLKDVADYTERSTDYEFKSRFLDNALFQITRAFLIGQLLPELGITKTQLKRVRKFVNYALEMGSPEAKELNNRGGVYHFMLEHYAYTVSKFQFPTTKDASTVSTDDLIEQSVQVTYLTHKIIVPYAKQLELDMIAFSKKPLEIVCPECGRLFEPIRVGQIYDKRACAAKAGERRRYVPRKNLASK